MGTYDYKNVWPLAAGLHRSSLEMDPEAGEELVFAPETLLGTGSARCTLSIGPGPAAEAGAQPAVPYSAA